MLPLDAVVSVVARPDAHQWQVVIIGAGQAGLATAYELARRGLRAGRDFVVLDASDGPGGAWRHRWDSLTLGRAHRIADLPGMALGEADPQVPASRVVADYYARYEQRFQLQVVRPAMVRSVRSTQEQAPRLHVPPPSAQTRALPAPVAQTRNAAGPSATTPTARGASAGESPSSPAAQDPDSTSVDGAGDIPRDTWLAVDADLSGERRTFVTRVVISATGTWTRPFVPWIPGLTSFGGRQLHTVDYRRAEDFEGARVIVVGGGLSAVQFLLELAPVAASTVWATRRPPNFTRVEFDAAWGEQVERAVDLRTGAGVAPASVVRTTGIPMREDYLQGVREGVLVSRGMFDRVQPRGVRFSPVATARGSVGLGPSQAAPGDLVVPESWRPVEEPTWVDADVLFWNTGFRYAIGHLRPLRLRQAGGGIRMSSRVAVARDPRVLLVGYGSSASTLGATRAGREAGRVAVRRLGLR